VGKEREAEKEGRKAPLPEPDLWDTRTTVTLNAERKKRGVRMNQFWRQVNKIHERNRK